MSERLDTADARHGSRLFSDIVRAIGLIVDLDEGVSAAHQWRTAFLARHIAEKLPGVDASHVFHAGLLHDVGAVGLPIHVLHAARSGFLEEASRKHPAVGARVLEAFSMFRDLAPTIADHHERYDGRGFPTGKRGPAIPIEASVLYMADALDVRLGQLRPHERPAAWAALCEHAGDRLVPQRVADAARTVLDELDVCLLEVFDDARIGVLVDQSIGADLDAPDIESSTLLPEALWLFARLLDTKHPGTMAHSTRVAFLAYQITCVIDPTANMWDVLWVGLLHDIGKVGLSGSDLDAGAPHRVADEEERHHARLTLAILSLVRDLGHLALPAAAHHERSDGSGPLGLVGEGIPLLGRIIAIADQYDVLTALRSSPLTHAGAIAAMRSDVAGNNDSHLFEAAVAVLDEHGAGLEDVPETMGRLYRFFDLETADVGGLIARRSGGTTSHQSVNGVLLYETEPWRIASLDEQFRIVKGLREIVELVGSDHGVEFGAYLCSEDRQELLPQLTMIRRDVTVTQYVFTGRGRPLEIIVVRRDAGYELFLRSAANRIQTLDRMAYFYRNFLSSTEAAFFADASGKIVDVNRTLLSLYGLKLRDAVGKTARNLLRCSEIPEPGDAQEGGAICGSWSGQVSTKRSDGAILPVHLSITQVRDVNGSAIGCIGHAVDLTEQRRLQDELERKNKELEENNRALERLNQKNRELMAITSHDLKAPVNAMIAYAELLGDPATTLGQKEQDTFLRRISAAGHKLIGFINSMLDIEKIEAGTFGVQPVSGRLDLVLASTLEDLRIFAASKGIELTFRAEGRGRHCLIDRGRLEQVCTNLIANAVKFSPPRSVVDVVYRETHDMARVEIYDEGPGIPEEDVEQIFLRFYQSRRTSSAGAGLGLAIAKYIVEQHSGKIWVENRPEGGALFCVEMPVLVHASEERTRADVIVVDAPGGTLADVADRLRLRQIHTLSVESVGELELVVGTEQPKLVVANETALSPEQSRILSQWRTSAHTPRFVHVGDPLDAHDVPFDDILTPPLLDRELNGVLRAVGLDDASRRRIP